jgi:hypothetical protein
MTEREKYAACAKMYLLYSSLKDFGPRPPSDWYDSLNEGDEAKVKRYISKETWLSKKGHDKWH